MLIKIISIGNKLNQWQSQGIEFYTKQLPKNLTIEFIDLKSQQNPNYSIEEVIQKESSLILSKISKNDYVVSWDSSGESMTSKNFSNFILKSQSNMSSILFIIGSTIDWKEDKFKRGFTFENPNETARCGCGESFSI